MRKLNLWRGDKRFWSPIAIGSGLTIFFFGIATVANDLARGLFTIGFGLLLLILGFSIAPIRESKPQGQGEPPDERPSSADDNEPGDTRAEYQMYREERKVLQDALSDQSRSYDKFVLTMAAGTFGLSFLFVQQFAPKPEVGTMIFLISAWVSFTVCICTTLLSFLLSQKACLRQIEILDEWLGRSFKGKQEPANVYTVITQIFNWLSMIAFVSGVILLIVFGANNVSP
jgi:hypothetical protein